MHWKTEWHDVFANKERTTKISSTNLSHTIINDYSIDVCTTNIYVNCYCESIEFGKKLETVNLSDRTIEVESSLAVIKEYDVCHAIDNALCHKFEIGLYFNMRECRIDEKTQPFHQMLNALSYGSFGIFFDTQ